MTDAVIRFCWIPKQCGGHRNQPWIGMRTSIRWQKHVDEWLKTVFDTELVSLEFDDHTNLGTATIRLFSDGLAAERTVEGARIELLDGATVIAVGIVVGTNGS